MLKFLGGRVELLIQHLPKRRASHMSAATRVRARSQRLSVFIQLILLEADNYISRGSIISFKNEKDEPIMYNSYASIKSTGYFAANPFYYC